ncbi:helix-turn-helix domain-containing protein [Marinoscillum sp.]|uniref:AraC family transcriptional regulator n=1 Tax=Marinoscillum sp. TaxID=2024838 RepID=UPI003BA9BE82
MITSNPTPLTQDFFRGLQHIRHDQALHVSMPDNHIHALLNLGQPIKKTVVGQIRSTNILNGELHLFGCQSRSMLLECDQLDFIEIRIAPVYTRLLFPNCDGFLINQSERELSPTLTNQEDLIDYLLTSYTWETFETDYILEEAIAQIIESKGDIKIRSIYELLGISKSHLEQKFIQQIGLTAKEFAKVEKLNNFMRNYDQYKDSMNLTQLTFRSGYYDQSHLIKDFRYFTDQRPGEFLKTYCHSSYSSPSLKCLNLMTTT